MAKGKAIPGKSTVDQSTGSAIKPVSDIQRDSTQVSQGCAIVGCVAHVQRRVSVNDVNYDYRVHFTSHEDILAHANKQIGLKVQAKIRAEIAQEATITFPQGRIVDIDSSCRFSRSVEDEANAILAMSPEHIAAKRDYFAALIAKLEMSATRA